MAGLVSSLPLMTLLEKNIITEHMYNTKICEEVFESLLEYLECM